MDKGVIVLDLWWELKPVCICFIQYISYMCPLPKNDVGLANLCSAKKIVSSFPIYLKIIQMSKGEKVVTIISYWNYHASQKLCWGYAQIDF